MATGSEYGRTAASNAAEESQFPSPFAPILRNPVPLLELRLRQFQAQITEKPRWWEKVHDPGVVARWTEEIVEHDRKMYDELWGGEKWFDVGNGQKQWPRDPVTEVQLRYLFEELRHFSRQRDAKTGITNTAIPMVYESSSLVTPALKASIAELARTLESVPDDEKDWHPGSNGRVLDLVHPSLYCLRIGSSFTISLQPGRADPLQLLDPETYFASRLDMSEYCDLEGWEEEKLLRRVPFEFTVSKQYQWLPTDFAISESGEASARSYINNFHPSEHRAGYTTISSILERFVPLFERVLSDELSPPPPSPFIIDPQRWYEHLSLPEDHWDDAPEGKAWRKANYWPRLPDAQPFQPPSTDGRVAFSLRGRTIQVIVKMANVVLTPDNPTYAGGSWHVEGMQNENIVATGLYYYDSENITESRLAFRAVVGDGEEQGAMALEYQQNDNDGYALVYGLAGDKQLNQQLGSIVAKEDKCLAFPNVYQHRVAPFELADRSRPGHRKILAFFLVDPLTSIHSTSRVPPQQAEWYRDAVRGLAAIQKLPEELAEQILGYVLEGTVTLEQAKADREDLMKERARFVVRHNEEIFEASFAMCEH